jgi:phosphoglycerate dehydrogenase-like enzyme
VTAVNVCVYHRTMGDLIAERIRRAYPDVEVSVVRDTSADPPHCDDIDVLIANTVPDGLPARCRRLRWLHLTGTGVDHLAGDGPWPGVVVTTSGRVPAQAVAEFVWMGLLALAKDAIRLVHRQRERRWELPDARLVAGSHLVLVGLGRIGREIAWRAPGFGVRVTAVTERGRPSPLVGAVLPARQLVEAARTADHLVLAVPGLPSTRGLVDAEILDSLPGHATLINVGRADVLDTAALAQRLRTGRLRAALLDVHDIEPLPAGHPLWTVPNLWLTPHGAYRFPQEEARVAGVFLENLADLRAGRPLRDRVELARGEATAAPFMAGARPC